MFSTHLANSRNRVSIKPMQSFTVSSIFSSVVIE